MDSTKTIKRTKVFNKLFVIILCSIIFITIYDLFNLNILFLIVFCIYLLKNIFFDDFDLNTLRFTWLDCAIVMIAITEVLSYVTSTYKENSFYGITNIFFLIIFYYWVKFNFKHGYQGQVVYFFITILGVFVFLDGIFPFYSHFNQLISLGFDNHNSFKYLFRFGAPAGLVAGEWLSIFLAFLPFAVIMLINKHREGGRSYFLFSIPVITNLIVLVISCYRGLYLAVVSFAFLGSALIIFYKLAHLKNIIFFNLLFLFIIGLFVVTPFLDPVMNTISMVQTTSQIRSIEARKDIWKEGVGVVKNYPLLGIGSDNYPLKIISYKDQNDEAPFTGRVFNFFLQIAIEKGLIGLFAYLFLIITFFYVSHRKIKLLDDWNQKVVVVLFMSAYAAILVRDLTYSSILSNKGVHLLMWFMFAYNSQLPVETNTSQMNIKKKILLISPIIIYLCIFLIITVASIQKQKGETKFISFVEKLNQGKYEKAEQDINSAINISPNNAYYLSGRGLLVERALKYKFHFKQFIADSIIISEREKEQIHVAIDSYKRAIALNPSDSWFHHNLGWLYIYTRDWNNAEESLRQAIQIENTIAVYHISLGMLMEKVGKKDIAIDEYIKALVILPSLLDSPFFIDLNERMKKESEQIVKLSCQYLEDKAKIKNDPIKNAKLAKIYLYQNEKQKAQMLLEQVTNELPNLSRPWLYLGDIYQACKKDSEMVLFYKRAAFLDRLDILPLLRLGQYYDKRNEVKEAIQYYTKLEELIPRQYTEHARRVMRMYLSNCRDDRYIIKDDLIPNGLLRYCSPYINISSVYESMSILHAKIGNNAKAEEYSKLSKEHNF